MQICNQYHVLPTAAEQRGLWESHHSCHLFIRHVANVICINLKSFLFCFTFVQLREWNCSNEAWGTFMEADYAALREPLQPWEVLFAFFFKSHYTHKGYFILHHVCVQLCWLHFTNGQVCHSPGHITMVSYYHSNEPSSPLQQLL